jgi:flagellar L-ring protein precursor FlgH
MNRISLFILSCCLFLPTTAFGQYKCDGPTLWERRAVDGVFLFRDTAARSVGDLLTILVRESTDVGNRDQRAMGKDSDASFNFDTASAGGGGSASGTFDIGAKSDRSFNGTSTYTAARDFTDRMTVEVQQVRPNGDLVISGKRRQLIAGEIRTLCLSGIVRANDVGPGNTVRSQYIADLNMCYEGDGPETHFSNQNWAGRIANKLWPF